MARFPKSSPFSATFAFSLLILSIISHVVAKTTYIVGTDAAGVSRKLANDRFPALYTGDYGDCLAGGSLLNITQFDAAYYADNMTVLFHLSGTTSLRNESIMIYILVDAYGEERFDITFNPCTANIQSMCPMTAATPLTGEAIIPVGVSDIQGIPPIALQIPDFEGSASVRIFSNSTKTEIGCFRAVMKNGATMSQPAAIGSVLGVFTLVALISSFAVAIYGVSIPHMRTHYGHALPVLVVFEVFQSIYFSGTLNLNWPSICVAWWSNFAWSAGMIYSKSMVQSVNKFVGVAGNSSQVGGAGSSVINNNGGLQQQIYGRSLQFLEYATIGKRAATGSDTYSPTYSWAGVPVAPGLPVPGNWSGFAGQLQESRIPVNDAFMIGFLWFIILLVIIAAAVIAFKWILEGLARFNRIKEDRLAMFRTNWLGYLGLVVLRTAFIAIPMMLILTLFQFALLGKPGVIAIAAIVFFIFLVGGFGVAGYACFYRLRFGHYVSSPDHVYFQRKKAMKIFPWFRAVRESSLRDEEKATVASNKAGSLPMFRITHVNNKELASVHDDVEYIKHFGWLTAHYRRSTWWFFAVWVVYQFVRACFVGGSPGHPTTQVVGLFVIELIALIGIFWIRPFEGRRNTAVAVYMLSISKVATAGLSISFLPTYKLARIPTTVIGVVIIVIQGFLVIGLMILIVLSAISSYMSLTRNHEAFTPRSWQQFRVKYFLHLEKTAPDVPRPKPVKVVAVSEGPKEPYFSVNSVRRAPKIEDEDMDFLPELDVPGTATGGNAGDKRRSRTNSMRSTYSSSNVPFGARVHRASWSSRDFEAAGIASRPPNRNPGSRRSTMSDYQLPPSMVVRSVASMSNVRPKTPTA